MGKGFEVQGVGLTRQVEPYRFIDNSNSQAILRFGLGGASQITLRKL
jgi:hypothetical protein